MALGYILILISLVALKPDKQRIGNNNELGTGHVKVWFGGPHLKLNRAAYYKHMGFSQQMSRKNAPVFISPYFGGYQWSCLDRYTDVAGYR